MLQHPTRRRVEFALVETLAEVSRSISVAELERSVVPLWVGGSRTWTARVTLLGDPPGALASALAHELEARGYRVTMDQWAQQFFGGGG